MLAGQMSLFAHQALSFDHRFSGLQRIPLGGEEAWLEYQPGWLSGQEVLFDALATSTSWQEGERQMYDRMVNVPRLVAVLPQHGPGHPVLEEMRQALSARYGEDFVRVSLALYRGGNDSVAWHGDQVAREMERSVMASVSLGAPRRFLMRPRGGGARSFSMTLGWGDLLVMGGTSQRTHQHAIPKVAHADPRMVIMFRPAWGHGYPQDGAPG